jgi:iron complex transport system substrate-binding protein
MAKTVVCENLEKTRAMAATPSSPRLVSLLPAATEMAVALGLADALVGRSHECDHPPEVTRLPALTTPRIDAAGSSRDIHEQVERATAMFTLDAERLAALRPEVILTQAACDVCAVAEADVAAAASSLDPPPRIVSLSSTTLAGVFADIRAVGAATGRLAKAREVGARLQARCDSVACRTRQLAGSRRPRVAMIEWLDPPMAAGNWVPEMVQMAGGDDVLGHAGQHSHWIGWDDVAAADPDVVVLVPCGFTLERVLAEAASAAVRPQLESLRAFSQGRVWAVDGHHLFNRPGPRLVDSLEVLAEVLHPGQFAFAATRRFARPLP